MESYAPLIGSQDTALLQSILWTLVVVSVLLTLRAFLSGFWFTMWLAALVSLLGCLIAIWSIGSLVYLLTCFQVAAAVALNRSVSAREWAALLFCAALTFAAVIFGLAFVRAWELWLVAVPLAFVAWSTPLFGVPIVWRSRRLS